MVTNQEVRSRWYELDECQRLFGGEPRFLEYEDMA